MKHFESYVAEAKARRRRRITGGILGAGLLASLALWALASAGVLSSAASEPAMSVDAGARVADSNEVPAQR